MRLVSALATPRPPRHQRAMLAPASPLPPPDAAAFRDAMSRVVAAVHLVATDGPAGLAGLTATAFSTVTDSPPTLLVCLNRQSEAADRLETNRLFGVSVLPAGCAALADRFAGRTGLRGRDRFLPEDQWGLLAGAPVLPKALAAFACRPVALTPIGTHVVVVADVIALRINPPGPGLAYKDRRYHDV